MGLLAFKVRLQHRATKDTTRPKKAVLGPRHETAYLLRLNRMGRPSPGFPKMRNSSTCGFYSAKLGMVEGDRLNVVDRHISWRTNKLRRKRPPPPQKKSSAVAKCPAGRRLLAGQRRGAYLWRTEGLGMGFCRGRSQGITARRAGRSRRPPLMALEKRERLDVIGGGHDGLDLAADNLHKVLELHLVRQCRVDGRNLHLQRLVPVGGAVVGELVQAGSERAPLVPPIK